MSPENLRKHSGLYPKPGEGTLGSTEYAQQFNEDLKAPVRLLASAALALTLEDGRVLEMEKALRTMRQVLDRDEVRVSFTFEHDRACPAYGGHINQDRCACGLQAMIHTLRDAEHAAEMVRATLARVAKAIGEQP